MHLFMLHSSVGVSVMCSYDICTCFIQIVDVMPHSVALSASLFEKNLRCDVKIIKTKIGMPRLYATKTQKNEVAVVSRLAIVWANLGTLW